MNKLNQEASMFKHFIELWSQVATSRLNASKKVLIDIRMLRTPPDILKQDSARQLFARLVFSLAESRWKAPVSRNRLEVISTLIDPNLKAMVTEETVRSVFHVSAETLNTYRETGLLDVDQSEQGYLYEWNQMRILFGSSGKQPA